MSNARNIPNVNNTFYHTFTADGRCCYILDLTDPINGLPVPPGVRIEVREGATIRWTYTTDGARSKIPVPLIATRAYTIVFPSIVAFPIGYAFGSQLLPILAYGEMAEIAIFNPAINPTADNILSVGYLTSNIFSIFAPSLMTGDALLDICTVNGGAGGGGSIGTGGTGNGGGGAGGSILGGGGGGFGGFGNNSAGAGGGAGHVTNSYGNNMVGVSELSIQIGGGGVGIAVANQRGASGGITSVVFDGATISNTLSNQGGLTGIQGGAVPAPTGGIPGGGHGSVGSGNITGAPTRGNDGTVGDEIFDSELFVGGGSGGGGTGFGGGHGAGVGRGMSPGGTNRIPGHGGQNAAANTNWSGNVGGNGSQGAVFFRLRRAA